MPNENNIETIKGIINMTSEVQYSSYIQGEYFEYCVRGVNASVHVIRNEIILYGKKGKKMFFYYIKEGSGYDLTINEADDKDEEISCKLVKENINICAIPQNGQIRLKFILHIYFDRTVKGMMEKYSKDIDQFNNHENAILYDTENSKYKITCARRKDNCSIECLAVYLNINYNFRTSSFEVNLINIDNYQSTYTNNLDNCNYTRYNSEYLICCGKTNSIDCNRRFWNFSLINNFAINLPGKISNMTIESSQDNIKLLYSNETENENGLYEYNIYPPKCNSTYIEITTNGKGELNLNELYERVTDTKYYITIKDLPTSYVNVKINNEIFNGGTIDSFLLENKENILTFTSYTDQRAKFLDMPFNISIEESYPMQCKIRLSIKSCYKTCHSCSIKGDLSDKDNHNCIQCKEGYYPFSENGKNCYTLEEGNNHTNWYFDESSQYFGLCHSSCKSCSGPLEQNCLTCDDSDSENPKYLYNGKCIAQCPEGTFISTDSNENKICKNCYKNCKTCDDSGNAGDMKCTSCPDNNIKYLHNCYEISDSNIKSFYDPEDNTKITSCFQLHEKYIKDTEYECIDEYEENYYISNPVTGLVSQCDSNCKTCSQTSTNCLSCADELYLQEGQSVSNCPSNYYIDNKNCFKCHDNCLSCNTGKILDESGKLISMSCLTCIETPQMIKNEENCFPVDIYQNDKITFNINEIDSTKTIGNCYDFGKAIFHGTYECISKPSNTYYVLKNEDNTGVIKNCDVACDTCLGEKTEEDTNCINCAPGYAKIKETDTNCILESLIPTEPPIITEKPTEKILPESPKDGKCPENLFKTLAGECVSNCPSGTYQFLLNHTCLESCPDNYKVNNAQTRCIKIK